MEPSALPCCRSYDHIKELDGQRVILIGTYNKVRVTKRRDQRPPDLTTPGTAQILTETGAGIMLEIYYSDPGLRSVEEIQRFHGKRVEVVGVIHLATPTMYSPDGYALATMIGPYIGAIESIELAE